MTQFTETAPGVRTATLINDRTGRYHNIAVIETSGAWTLFIDGELAVRDLPSFDAAVATAEAKVLTANRSSRAARVVGILTVLTFLGGSSIWAASMIGAVFAGPEPGSGAKPVASVAVARYEPVPRVKPSAPAAPVAAVVINSKPAETSKPEAPAFAEPPAVRRFSATNPVTSAPSLQPATKKTAAPSIETVVITETPVVFGGSDKSAPVEIPVAVIIPAPEPPAPKSASPEPVTVTTTTPDPNVETAEVPLPAPTPTPPSASNRPLIRYATAPIDRNLLKEIDEREADPTTEEKHVTPQPKTHDDDRANQDASDERKDTQRRARRAAEREEQNSARRRAHRKEQRWHNRRRSREDHEPRIRTVERYEREPPRMVCFAHTCRFR